jgi:hypothetical protein
VQLPCSVSESTHRFDRFHYFTSCWPTLSSVWPLRSNQSFASKTARSSATNYAGRSALDNLLSTIPIDNRRCFTQRFSPTGFILNASHCNCCYPIASARIQVKTYPFSSILRRNWSSSPRRLWFFYCRKSHFSSLGSAWYVAAMKKAGWASALVAVILLAVAVIVEAQQPAKVSR